MTIQKLDISEEEIRFRALRYARHVVNELSDKDPSTLSHRQQWMLQESKAMLKRYENDESE